MSEKTKILVVDDNEEFCRNVRDILEMKDYAVATAYDGFQALELVKQDGFDLVLMDIRMPAMDGVETFKRIKEMAPDLPVIMVTAFAVEDLIRDALREGAFGALYKPLDFDKLLGLVERAAARGMLILVVDDDESLCATIRDILSDRGYQVSVACDGDTAVQMARETSFDIMLIDMKLPPVNGLVTYLSIRDIRPNVKAIIITGYSRDMNELIQQALRNNASACLEKPIDMDDLISLLGCIKEHKAGGTPGKPR